MFSVFGYGADVGIDTKKATDINKVKLANKTELLRAVGDVNSAKSYWTVYPNVNTAYNNAVKLTKVYNPSQASINSATTALKNAVKYPKNPVVGAVKIKSAKNAKGKKIKVTSTKISGITGFQIKYGNNKKLKNKKKKKWKATTVKQPKQLTQQKRLSTLRRKKHISKLELTEM